MNNRIVRAPGAPSEDENLEGLRTMEEARDAPQRPDGSEAEEHPPVHLNYLNNMINGEFENVFFCVHYFVSFVMDEYYPHPGLELPEVPTIVAAVIKQTMGLEMYFPERLPNGRIVEFVWFYNEGPTHTRLVYPEVPDVFGLSPADRRDPFKILQMVLMRFTTYLMERMNQRHVVVDPSPIINTVALNVLKYASVHCQRVYGEYTGPLPIVGFHGANEFLI